MDTKDKIIVESVSKRFRNIKALNSVSFSFDKDEVFGLLGPNGAGKTTLVRIMVTLLAQSEGRITIFGNSIDKNRQKIRQLVGYVPAGVILFPHLTAKENLLYFASLYRIKREHAEKRVEELLKTFDMWEWRNEYVKNFSTGMAQKINICRGILHDPKMLILDEPTNGLDPKSRQVVRDFVLDVNSSGTAVLLTTHAMWSVEEICRRVAIIDRGNLITVDTVKNLKREELKNQREVKVFISGLIRDRVKFRELEDVSWIENIEHEDQYSYVITLKGNAHVKELQKKVVENFDTVDTFRVNEPTLEDIFISLTKKVS